MFLEGVAADGSVRVYTIAALPHRIGRDPSNDLVIEAAGLSRHHATLEAHGADGIRVVDHQSTNGTYVNRQRIAEPTVLQDSDVLHFGNAEFRLRLAGGKTIIALKEAQTGEQTIIVPSNRRLSERFVRHEREFMELLGGRGLSGAVQPIVQIRGGQLFAYELLGRCTHPELPASPVQLFHLAAVLDREAELSEAFRNYGVQAAAPRLHGTKLFINTHPKETFAEEFFQALQRLSQAPGAPQLVVEVHEAAVVEVDRMRELAARLAEIGVPFAYDDFGAGQPRLAELGDVTPHFVKFDMGLIRGIHAAGEGKQRVVRDLVRLVLDLGSVPLAEGVESEAEAAVCREMGFQLVQGYLTGRPVSIDQI